MHSKLQDGERQAVGVGVGVGVLVMVVVVVAVVLVGLEVEMVGGEGSRGGRGDLLVCRNRILQLVKAWFQFCFRRVFVSYFVLCRVLGLKCVFGYEERRPTRCNN